MKLEDIGFYTLCDDRARTASVSSPLWRCELVLTDACNFRCPYCRGMRGDCKGTMPADIAMSILDGWCDQGLRHVRFSGGEPTLYKGLPELITRARERGVRRIAVSTNGSATRALYTSLTKLGVNDWSISLDACCSAFGDKMSGVTGTWKHVIDNIMALSSYAYVTVGIVFTEDNVEQALETVLFAHELGVDDIRVISAAQYNQAIGALEQIPEAVLSEHPILKYRISRNRAGLGVRGIKESDNRLCPLVVDDIAVAGSYHFPCIIYLREQGEPIGSALDPIDKIRSDREVWSKTHDCYADAICRANCLDVCVAYNNKVRDFKEQVQ